MLLECRAVMEQSRSPIVSFQFNPSAQRYWFINWGFCSALVLRHVYCLNAASPGNWEITWGLKVLEVGVRLEHCGIWIRDALPGDESPRSLHLPVLSESNFFKIQEVGIGKEVFPSEPGRAWLDGLCRPRKACWCVCVCQDQSRYLQNPTCDASHW